MLEQFLPFAVLVLIVDRVDGFTPLTYWTAIAFFWIRVAHAIGMISRNWTNIVTPHEDGTELTIDVDYAIPVPVLVKLAENLAVRRNERGIQFSLLTMAIGKILQSPFVAPGR